MSDETTSGTARGDWRGAAGAWLAAWLIVSLVLVVVALLVAATYSWIVAAHSAAQDTPILTQTRTVSGIVVVFAGLALALESSVVCLAALPLQATALRFRLVSGDAETLAGVAALSTLSAALSFGLLYAIAPSLWPLEPEWLAAVLVGFYAIHAIILVMARALAGRR